MAILKKIDSPAAKELAETVLLLADVHQSISAIELWFKKFAHRKLESGSEESTIHDSLYRDAIVQFVGCFDKSAEFRLDPTQVFVGLEGGSEFVQYLKDIRDSFAAHKFGPLRQCVAGVVFDPDQGGVFAVGWVKQIAFCLGKNSESATIAAFRSVGKYLEKRVEELQDQVLDEATLMPEKELLALEDAKTYAVNSNELMMSRSALQGLRTGKSTSMRRSKQKRDPA